MSTTIGYKLSSLLAGRPAEISDDLGLVASISVKVGKALSKGEIKDLDKVQKAELAELEVTYATFKDPDEDGFGLDLDGRRVQLFNDLAGVDARLAELATSVPSALTPDGADLVVAELYREVTRDGLGRRRAYDGGDVSETPVNRQLLAVVLGHHGIGDILSVDGVIAMRCYETCDPRHQLASIRARARVAQAQDAYAAAQAVERHALLSSVIAVAESRRRALMDAADAEAARAAQGGSSQGWVEGIGSRLGRGFAQGANAQVPPTSPKNGFRQTVAQAQAQAGGKA